MRTLDHGVLPLDFNMRKILEEDHVGRALFRFYSMEKTLVSRNQNFLVEKIVGHLFQIGYRIITSNSFMRLANMIVELFPTENARTYFVPASNHQVSKGKLVDKYRNKRLFLRQSGLIISRREEHIPNEDQVNESLLSLAWLKSHSKKYCGEIFRHWKICYRYREAFCKSWANNLPKIIEEFPCLNLPEASDMVSVFLIIYFKAFKLDYPRFYNYLGCL